MRHFYRIEIFALDIFNQRDFQQALIREILNDDRNFRETGETGCSPATLASDQLMTIAGSAYDQGLDNPIRPDGLGEFIQSIASKDGSWLNGIGIDCLNGEFLDCGRQYGYLGLWCWSRMRLAR